MNLRFLAEELAFHGEEESSPDDPDAGARQCLDFICRHGGEQLVKRKEKEIYFLSGSAGPIFANARAAAFRSVDIKGQL